jgi:hypothetical protein
MAPSFLKDLRRRSRASFKTDESSAADFHNGPSNGFHNAVLSPSSSTLNSTYGATTPPALSSSNSTSNLQAMNGASPIPSRPPPPVPLSSRHSVSGMAGLGAPSPKSSLPTSQYAPRILSISDNSWVGPSLPQLASCAQWLTPDRSIKRSSLYMVP